MLCYGVSMSCLRVILVILFISLWVLGGALWESFAEGSYPSYLADDQRGKLKSLRTFIDHCITYGKFC